MAGDGHDLWEGQKAKGRSFNSLTKSGGQRKKGQKEKPLREGKAVSRKTV